MTSAASGAVTVASESTVASEYTGPVTLARAAAGEVPSSATSRAPVSEYSRDALPTSELTLK